MSSVAFDVCVANDDDLLHALAALSPEELRQLVEQIRLRRKRGRPAKSAANYRKLELWWKCFRRLNSELAQESAARKFLRIRGSKIARLLNLKRDTAGSLRNAVARGAKESTRLNDSRRTSWQIVPAGLARAVHGRQWRLVTNSNEAVLLRAAQKAAWLGEG
jgi:hypothetical protein